MAQIAHGEKKIRARGQDHVPPPGSRTSASTTSLTGSPTFTDFALSRVFSSAVMRRSSGSAGLRGAAETLAFSRACAGSRNSKEAPAVATEAHLRAC